MDVKRLYWQFLDIEIWKFLTVRFLLFTEKKYLISISFDDLF